ncbi:MAG: hypothetical protein B7Y39_15135 [Bdellovibrio sp. 28-41-41]|nr:MAG: hypothetical protein B7Y39_15135 [Bdellovibrio sp. 28-41-41]
MIYEELNSLSNRELIDLEDTLLLEREMDPQMRIRHTGGRFVLLMLTGIIWLVLTMTMASKLTQMTIKSNLHGIISVVGFSVSFGLSVYLSHLIWRKSGVKTRVFIRNAVHYWPVTFCFIAGVLIFLKG